MDMPFTYSAWMRFLRKKSPEKINTFMENFQKNFDQCISENLNNSEEIALMQTLKSLGLHQAKVSFNQEKIFKWASVIIEMGEPKVAGKGLADIVKFFMKRVEPNLKPEYFFKLRRKISDLNEQDIASKSTPESSTLGQSITFLKTVLNGHNPKYIREVLNNVITHLH